MWIVLTKRLAWAQLGPDFATRKQATDYAEACGCQADHTRIVEIGADLGVVGQVHRIGHSWERS